MKTLKYKADLPKHFTPGSNEDLADKAAQGLLSFLQVLHQQAMNEAEKMFMSGNINWARLRSLQSNLRKSLEIMGDAQPVFEDTYGYSPEAFIASAKGPTKQLGDNTWQIHVPMLKPFLEADFSENSKIGLEDLVFRPEVQELDA